MKEFELNLYKDMVDIYKKAEESCGYKARRFLQMINDKGALITAKTLINKDSNTEGFIALWENNRLDLSLEALIVSGKYDELFTEEEKNICRNRLRDYGYKI